MPAPHRTSARKSSNLRQLHRQSRYAEDCAGCFNERWGCVNPEDLGAFGNKDLGERQFDVSMFHLPWIQGESDRAAAIIVAACVTAMVLVAWRIASAPPLLFGNDLEAEQVVDRETRAIRTGNTCIVTLAPVIFFIGFVGTSSTPEHPISELFVPLLVCWVGLFVWMVLYTRRLARASLAS